MVPRFVSSDLANCYFLAVCIIELAMHTTVTVAGRVRKDLGESEVGEGGMGSPLLCPSCVMQKKTEIK